MERNEKEGDERGKGGGKGKTEGNEEEARGKTEGGEEREGRCREPPAPHVSQASN